MAWIEDEVWQMEQGIDNPFEFQLFEDDEGLIPFQFIGWDVNATVSDSKGKTVWPVTVDVTPEEGNIRLIFSEASVAQLNPNNQYRYDCLLVSPGSDPADDYFAAAGPVTVAIRSTRRDPQ